MPPKKLNILGIIPARSGSKGLPGKNIKLLAGKPLIAYTIESARRSKYLTRIIVSTDSPEIAGIAERFGAEIPFLRPTKLAQDDTPMLPVLQHAVRSLEKSEHYKPDFIVTLQPTSPLRKPEHIDAAIKIMIHSKADSVVSLCPVEHSPYWMKKIENDRVLSLLKGSKKFTRRQDLPVLYRLNGAVYVTTYDVLMRQNKILGEDTRALIMNREESIDIDDALDMKIADMILKEKKANGPHSDRE